MNLMIKIHFSFPCSISFFAKRFDFWSIRQHIQKFSLGWKSLSIEIRLEFQSIFDHFSKVTTHANWEIFSFSLFNKKILTLDKKTIECWNDQRNVWWMHFTFIDVKWMNWSKDRFNQRTNSQHSLKVRLISLLDQTEILVFSFQIDQYEISFCSTSNDNVLQNWIDPMIFFFTINKQFIQTGQIWKEKISSSKIYK